MQYAYSISTSIRTFEREDYLPGGYPSETELLLYLERVLEYAY